MVCVRLRLERDLTPRVDLEVAERRWGPDGAGGLRLVMREGDPVPGLEGVTFLPYYDFDPDDMEDVGATSIALNDRGDVAFLAAFAGEGVIPANTDRGLFYSRADGSLELVARLGEFIEVAPGQERAVVGFSPWRFDIDNRGDIVFPVSLWEDGLSRGGVLRAHVPEPGAGALLAAGALALAWRGRRRRCAAG